MWPVDPNQFKEPGALEAELKRLTNGRGPSVVIECSGNDIGIASLFDIAGHSARIGVVGHSIGRKVPVEIGKTIWKTLHIAGSGGTTNWFPRTIRFLSRIKDRYDFKMLLILTILISSSWMKLWIWPVITRTLHERLC